MKVKSLSCARASATRWTVAFQAPLSMGFSRQEYQSGVPLPSPTTCKRMKLDHFLTPYTKINSKWIKNLNIRPGTIKLLEENRGKTLSDINQSRILYDPPPRRLEIKAKINKYWKTNRTRQMKIAAQGLPRMKDPVSNTDFQLCINPGSELNRVQIYNHKK